MSALVRILTVVQAMLAIRVFARMASTARGSRIERAAPADSPAEQVTVLLPVLNEIERVSPCLAGLSRNGPEIAEILVIDGGSIDHTPELVDRWSARDPRIRLIDASPVPTGVNGKAYGLQIGLDHAMSTPWVLTIDADVRPDGQLVRSMLVHAEHEGVPAMSAATRQQLSGVVEGMVHPTMLATLVYRYGIPGNATRAVDRVQANGQCFLSRREVLDRAGGFAATTASVCEDVTLARQVARQGGKVGFYETDDLVRAEMYAGWREAWDNWTRSLPMRDRHSGWQGRVGLAEIVLVQAAPLWLAALYRWRLGREHPSTLLNVGLLLARVGVLCGMARAYVTLPWTYWLSPLTDLPVAMRLVAMWRRRDHRWRGRDFTSGDDA